MHVHTDLDRKYRLGKEELRKHQGRQKYPGKTNSACASWGYRHPCPHAPFMLHNPWDKQVANLKERYVPAKTCNIHRNQTL